MRTIIVALFVAVLVIVVVPLAAEQTILLEADYWMPFNGDGKTETGYMLDIAKAIFEPKGIKVEYRVVPWTRAIQDAKNGACSGIVGAYVNDAPDFIFPKEEQGLSILEFFVKSGSAWKYDGISSLKGCRLAVIKDYSYFSEIDEYMATNPTQFRFAYGNDALRENIKLLVSGEVTALLETRSVVQYLVKTLKLSGSIVAAGTGGDPVKTYIAFSPTHPNSEMYAKLLSDGMVQLRKSGELKKILAKYGLSDWK